MRYQLACALAAAALLALLGWPEAASGGVRGGLATCGGVIIPSLFPFFVLSAAVSELGIPQRLARRLAEPMSRLFGVSGAGASALVLGVLGGYPLGAASAADMAGRGVITSEECSRLLGFCNNSGPGFLLGVVGIGVFDSADAGLRLYAVHIAAALLVGLCFRRYRANRPSAPVHTASRDTDAKNLPQVFTDAVSSSFFAVLNICAFVFFFMIFLRLLSITGLLQIAAAVLEGILSPFGMTEHLATALLAGILELSTGSACLQGAALTPGTAALAAFLLGWGGLSVHCQSLLFVLETDLSCTPYFLGKFLQGVFSALLAFVLFSL